MPKTEHDIQNEIRLELSRRGYLTERINVGSGYLVNQKLLNRIKQSVPPDLRAELARLPYFSTGAVKGRSDLSAIKDGKISFIEVKDATGRPSEDQVKFIDTVKARYGCRAGIARSVEDSLKIVDD